MFQPKSKLRFTRWIIGTGRVNSGWLGIKHAAALTCSAFRKQSSLFEGLFYLYFVFKWIISFSKWYIIMSTKQNLCRYVIFSQNCCFVANFVDKGLVGDNTIKYWSTQTIFHFILLLYTVPEMPNLNSNKEFLYFSTERNGQVLTICTKYYTDILKNI